MWEGATFSVQWQKNNLYTAVWHQLAAPRVWVLREMSNEQRQCGDSARSGKCSSTSVQWLYRAKKAAAAAAADQEVVFPWRRNHRTTSTWRSRQQQASCLINMYTLKKLSSDFTFTFNGSHRGRHGGSVVSTAASQHENEVATRPGCTLTWGSLQQTPKTLLSFRTKQV